MRRLLSRTSITIDEAVAILLGRITGPVDFEPKDDSEEAEANCPAFCLQETLEDELDVLDGEYRLAKHEKRSAHFIAEKLAALQSQEATIEQANRHLCAIEDELNKGEQSMLKVDRALSNAAYTYITLHSFNEWVKCRDTPREQSGAAKPKSRIKLLQQEEAILAEMRKQGFDPKALPKKPTGLPGAKSAVCNALDGSEPFEAKTAFEAAWERLRKQRRIVDKA